MIKLNGNEIGFDSSIKLSDLLLEAGFNLETIVVTLNSEILTKNLFDKTDVNDKDVIEVLNFVGGG